MVRYNIMSPIDFHVLLSCIHHKYLMTGVEVWPDWGGTGGPAGIEGEVWQACVCVCSIANKSKRKRERLNGTESRKEHVCVCMGRVR